MVGTDSIIENSQTFFYGAGNERGTGIAIGGASTFVSAESALVLKYGLPPAAAPEWSRSIDGGTAFWAVAATANGAFAAGQSYGRTNDTLGHKETKTFLARYDNAGNLLWTRGGPGNLGPFFYYSGVENFWDAAAAQEGGSTYVYAAGGGQPCSYRGYILAKYDAAGNYLGAATDSSVGVVFNSCSAPSAGGSDAMSVAASNGNVYLAGVTSWSHEDDASGRPAVWKYDSNLGLQWRRKEASLWGSFRGVTTLGGSIYAVGYANTPGVTNSEQYLIAKYDGSGNPVWRSVLGGAGMDVLTDVVAIGSRLFAVGHTTSAGAGGKDGVVMQIDPATGNILASRLWGGSSADMFNGAATDGKDLYAVGESPNAGGQNGVALVRYGVGPEPTTLAVSGGGTYGGRLTLQAVLSDGSGSPVTAGAVVNFTLFGSSVGSAQTDADGKATLSNVLAGGSGAGVYAGAIGASFGGDSASLGSSATGDLTIARASATITVLGSGSFVFDNQPHPATASVTGVLGEALGPASVTYTDLATNASTAEAPVNLGSYRVSASFAGNTNYLPASHNSSTITIRPGIGDLAVDIGNTAIAKLNGQDGSVVWSRGVLNDGALAVDPVDYSVYTGKGGGIGGAPGTIYKYGAAGGLAWTNTISVPGCNFYYVNNAAVDTTSSSPGVVWTQTGCYGGIAKSHRATGTQQWSVFTNDIGRPSIEPASGEIYAITSAGPGYGYNSIYRATATGSLSSAGSCEGPSDLNPADGMLYRSCGRMLHQVDRISLTANWTMSLPQFVGTVHGVSVQPWSRGFVYLAVSGAGFQGILVVNPASQTIVRSFPTSVPPHHFAVNPNGGTVFVASSSFMQPYVFAYSSTGTLLWVSPNLGGPVYSLAAPRGIVGTSAAVATTTALSSTPNPSAAGAAATFTATVTSAGGTPTGTVLFKRGGSALGNPVPLTNGSAVLTTSALLIGSHEITAEYSGAEFFVASTGSIAHTVTNAGAPTITSTGGPYITGIGENLVLNGTASDPDVPYGDTLTYAWDINNDGVADFTGASGQTTIGWNTLKVLLGIDEQTQTTTQATVRLSVRDATGTSTAATTGLTVYPDIVVPSLTIGSSVCDQATLFDASASRNLDPRRSIVSYTFDFGDGSTHTETRGMVSADGLADGKTTHTYSRQGTYTAVLRVVDSNGRDASLTRNVQVTTDNQPPVISSAGGRYIINIGQSLALNATATDANASCGDTLTFSWDVNSDGVIDTTGASPITSISWPALKTLFGINENTVTVTQSTITLRVTDQAGISATATASLTIAPDLVVPRLAVSGSLTCGGGPTRFDASASTNLDPRRSIVAYGWDFGDGSPRYVEALFPPAPDGTLDGKTTHTYTRAGSYTVTLGVVDDRQQTGWLTQTVTITMQNLAPTANAAGPYVASLGEGVSLNGLGSSDPNTSCGDSIAYTWTIGGLVFSGATPTLTASDVNALGAGTHAVSLQVTDLFGATHTASTSLSIYNNVPTASFTVSPNPAACQQPVSFNASTSSHGRPDRAIVNYAWDFGDGTTSSGMATMLNHSFAGFGTYTVTLTVTDNNTPAKTDTETATVSVSQGNHPPMVNAGGPYQVNYGSQIQLNGSATDSDTACGDSIVSYSWSIGSLTLSGATVVLSQNQVEALGAGTHNVTFSATDMFGATSNTVTTLTIRPVLVRVDVSPATATINAGQSRTFQAIGRFNDGTTQVLQSGGGGTGGGSMNQLLWNVAFAGVGPAGGMALNVDACSATPVPGGFGSQGFATDVSTGAVVPTTWEPGNPIVRVVSGQMTATDVSVMLQCANSTDTASFSGTWNGSAYVGTYTDFAGHSDAVTVTPRSLVATDRSDTQLRLQWGANGNTFWTLDYLGPAVFGGAQPTCGDFPPHNNVFETASTSPTIGNLQPSSWYHIHVHPLSATGQTSGNSTNVIIVRTRAAGSTDLERVWTNSPDYIVCGNSGGGGGGGSSSIPTVQWMSSDTFRVGVNGSGVVTAYRPGGATIRAVSSNGISCEATGSCATVTVPDTTPPTLNLPSNSTVEAMGPDGATVNFFPSAWDDVDGQRPVSCNRISGSRFAIGETTVTCTASDISGNVANGSFRVLVQDTTPPMLNVPSQAFIETATSAAGAMVNYSFAVSAFDRVDGNVSPTCNPPSGSTFAIGTSTVSCQATDSRGNVSQPKTFTIQVNDRPTVTLPGDITAEASSAAGAAVPFTVTSRSFAGDSLPVECYVILGFGDNGPQLGNPVASGATFPLGTTTVGCRSVLGEEKDGGFFTITVRDTTAPTVTVPANITGEATGPNGRMVSFPASASDLVTGAITPSCSPASDSTFPLGTTTVTCSATDGHANTGSASFTVTIVDTTAPTVTVPANITGEATGPNGRMVSFPSSASDAVAGALTPSCSPASDSTFPLGTTTVTCSATDGHANTGSASFTVTIVDTTPPVLTLPGNLTVDATSPAGAIVTYSATATDIVDGSITPSCTPASGSTLPIGTSTVSCSATDARGNTVSGTFTVLVQAAAEQVANLIARVETFNLAQGIQNSLDSKLQNVLSALSAAKNGNVANVCGQLGAFINETRAQSGKQLTAEQASQLETSARRIMAVIGCA